jgi:hypothetical protein
VTRLDAQCPASCPQGMRCCFSCDGKHAFCGSACPACP